MIDNYGNKVYSINLVDFSIGSGFSVYELKLGLYDTNYNRVVTEYMTFDVSTFDSNTASIDIANRMIEMLKNPGYPVFYFNSVDNKYVGEAWALAAASVVSALNAESEQQGSYLLYYPNVTDPTETIVVSESVVSSIFDSTKISIAEKLGLSTTDNSTALGIMASLVFIIILVLILIVLTHQPNNE